MHHAGWSGYCGHALMGAAAVALQRGLVHRAPGTPVAHRDGGGRHRRRGRRRPRANVDAIVQPRRARALAGHRQSGDLGGPGLVRGPVRLHGRGNRRRAARPLPERHARRSAPTRCVPRWPARCSPPCPRGSGRSKGITFVAADERGEADLRSATVYEDGAVDRSPGGRRDGRARVRAGRDGDAARGPPAGARRAVRARSPRGFSSGRNSPAWTTRSCGSNSRPTST